MSEWANTAAARSWASVKGPADHGRRYIEGLADALDAARAALWAGADDTSPGEGYPRTPAQWIAGFVGRDAAGRLAWAGHVIANAQTATDCVLLGHARRLDDLERLQRRAAARRAAIEDVCTTLELRPAGERLVHASTLRGLLACPDCLGTGVVWLGHGSCGGCSGLPSPAHEPTCGVEPCPWDCPVLTAAEHQALLDGGGA